MADPSPVAHVELENVESNTNTNVESNANATRNRAGEDRASISRIKSIVIEYIDDINIIFFNRYVLLRIILIIITLLLILISILYAIGQITTLELTEFICSENKTLDQIYEHSKENNLPHGTESECYTNRGS